MIEALLAFIVGILAIFVFGGPAWLMKLGLAGGVGFVAWVLIQILEWLFAKIKS